LLFFSEKKIITLLSNVNGGGENFKDYNPSPSGERGRKEERKEGLAWAGLTIAARI
jgi:hypothetical protein